MSMTTIVEVQDLVHNQQHLEELCLWTEVLEEIGCSTRLVRVAYHGFEAVGEVWGETASFSRSARESIWEICARVGIPFNFV